MNNHNILKFIFVWLLIFPAAFSGLTQNKILKGKITDVNGKPVLNTNILRVDNSNEGTDSDLDGKFVLNAEIDEYSKIAAPGVPNMNINVLNDTMADSIPAGNEYIPIGYGILRPKEEMTMAAGIVNSGELSRSSTVLSANALMGKIAGLSVLQNGGIPGSDHPSLQMGAPGTFRTNDLLVLVDGIERPLSFLALSEIESVVLLKDAPSLALYGLKGANGVLLVTTKMGSEQDQKTHINVGYETGLTKPFRKPVFYNAYDYAKASNEALNNDGRPTQFSQSDLDNYKSGTAPYFYPNVNWYDESFRDFGRRDHLNVSFRGSNKALKYFTLIDYLDDDGLFKSVNLNDGYSTQLKFQRINLRSNLDIHVTSSTILKIRVGGTLIDNNRPSESITNIMNGIYAIPSSAFPVKTPGGEWGGTSNYDNNPVALISSKGYSTYRTRGVMADLRLKQNLNNLLEGLSLEAAYSNDNIVYSDDTKSRSFQYTQIGLVKDPSTGVVSDTVETKYGQESTLNYNNSINNTWKGSTILGKLDYKKDWGNNTINSAIFFQREELVQQGRHNTFLHQLMAANVHFTNNGKYYADLSMSYAGTNLLPKKERYGFFPAVGVGWNLSKEDWFNIQVIEFLKLRASFGVIGNNRDPQNMEMSVDPNAPGYRFRSSNSSYGGWSQGKLAPDNQTFEKSHRSSFGLEANLFRKLSLNLNAFYDMRNDIMVTSISTVSEVVGLATAFRMGGIVINRGIDADVRFQDSKGRFNYYIIGRFSYGKSKIDEMFEEFRPFDYLNRTGESVGQAFGLEAIGFFKDASDIAASPEQRFGELKPGDVKYKDQNNDGRIDEFDEIPIGFSTMYPEIYYSGSFGLEYKSIGLDAVLQGIGNYTVYANTRNIFWPMYENGNISNFSDNRWTPETSATATLPAISTVRSNNNYRSNSLWLMNGAYLKLRSLQLYYDLPKNFISGLNNVRICLRGMDLFSIDHIDVVDPEVIGTSYPSLTSYHLGIKLGF